VTTTANRLPPPTGSRRRGTDHDHLHECNGLRRYDHGEGLAVHDHLERQRHTTSVGHGRDF
jgi:hypothetical protein